MSSNRLVGAVFALGMGVAATCAYGEAASSANEIDLDCQNYSRQLIQQLSTAGLLVEDGSSQAEGISLQLCVKAQKTAQVQHEAAKKKALDDWFFQSTGGKPGNERLKRK